jgi:Protein of unknown function (DUF4238)
LTAKPRLTPKGQHTVPRLHLKHFAGDRPKGHVWTYDKNDGSTRSGRPEETAVFTHFYSIERDDGTWDTSIEQALSENEAKAGPIYNRLIEGQALTDQQKADFAMFAALLYLRTPARVRDSANMIARLHQIQGYAYAAHDGAFETLMRKVGKGRGAPVPDEVKEQLRRRLADPSNMKILVPKELALEQLEVCNKLAPRLFDMNWSLVEPQHGFFITGDNPIVRWVDPETLHPSTETGVSRTGPRRSRWL